MGFEPDPQLSGELQFQSETPSPLSHGGTYTHTDTSWLVKNHLPFLGQSFHGMTANGVTVLPH